MQVFFKLVTEPIDFLLVVSHVLRPWCYERKTDFMHNSLHMAERIEFTNLLVYELTYLFCAYGTKLIVCRLNFNKNFCLKRAKPLLCQFRWSATSRQSTQCLSSFETSNPFVYCRLATFYQISNLLLIFSLFMEFYNKFPFFYGYHKGNKKN